MPEAQLDLEDDTLLLRLHQRMRGPLLRPGGQDALTYEHILVDEAQDLSPVELAVLTQTVSGGQSITLAGDVAQRLYMENGFTGWQDVFVCVPPIGRSASRLSATAEQACGPCTTPRRNHCGSLALLLGAPT